VLGVVNKIVETPRFAAEVYETVNAVEVVELDENVMLSTSDVVEVDGEMYSPSLFSKIKNGDIYYDAFYHEIKKCDTDNFFNPWCVKVVKY
jgi:hypothetical protein